MRLRAHAGQGEQLAGELHELRDATRLQRGNLEYRLHRSPSEPDSFLIYELWEDDEAFQAHTVTPEFRRHFLDGVAPLAAEQDSGLYDSLDG